MTDALFPIFGTGVAPMIGRKQTMDRLWRELTKPTPSHLQIVGPRFAGKTVLLHALAKRMRADESPFQVVLTWDLGHQTPDSNEAFLGQLCERMTTAFQEAAVPYADELLGLDPDDRYGTLMEVLEVLNGDGLRVLLLMDGFDKPLAGGKLTRNLWDQLRELGSLPNLRYVTASRRPLSQLIRSEESATSDFWNIFDQTPVRVETFDDDDMAAVIEQLPFELDSGARTELGNWSGHFPPLLLGLLNEVHQIRGDGRAGAAQINEVAGTEVPLLDSAVAALWADCPSATQDRFRDLLARGEQSHAELGPEHLSRLGERGFVRRAGNRVQPSCRLLKQHLERSQSAAGGMARLFGTWDAYAANMREVLERRVSHLGHIDSRLKRPVEQGISDVPDHPDDCLSNLTNIRDRVLDVVWRQEFGDGRILPQEIWDQWKWFDSSNRTVQELKDNVGRKIPGDPFQQCRMLELLTGSRPKFDSRARFATKDMYVLIDAIHTFRNRSQHSDGEPMRPGVAIAGLMLCVELLACIDSRLAETAG